MARKARDAVRKAAPRQLLCFIDRMAEDWIGGWAMDFDQPAESLSLRVVVDGAIDTVLACDHLRTDARLINNGVNNRIGLHYEIPERYRDGMRHTLVFTTLDGQLVPMASREGGALKALTFSLIRPVRIEASVDGLVDGLIQGWVQRVDDRHGTRTGGVRVLVTSDGHPIAELLADQFRGDVSTAVGGDSACGFAFALPPALQRRNRSTLRFFALPGRDELRGSPLDVAFPEDGARVKIEALIERADELFAFAYRLRQELKAAMPRERFLLADYLRWRAAAAPLIRARALARYGAADIGGVLVSIICPVYKPEIGGFLAAVDSVRAQTHENWELLLVDDASDDAVLSTSMQALAKADKRIKLIKRRKNGGISRATNDALAVAAGEFTAFFDHDDLLAPEALEVMLLAQRATGARLLYSDEDKVERGGAFSDPHFKSGYNYRLLLDVNYICHLVVAQTALLRQAGGLDPALDGAQDHDLLLRITEIVQPAEIHHVDEILYHWRKTASSTAAAGTQAKPKAGLAGAKAVAAHLMRRGLPAEVAPRGSLTCYQVDWKMTPARVKQAMISIFIPYRDHIEMTEACVAALRKNTRDVSYEIVLLDNWSTGEEAERFAAAQANIEGTRVVRIAEAFNFSRINNLGVAGTAAPFLLFLNNDVFVSDPGWLRRLLDEALADNSVGAVGAKLLYPGGTVQHAGVVLGVGGVADHAFRGIDAQAPGYMMRAMAAQQVSAVTAACMLVRRAAFEAVGGFDEAELRVAFNDVDLCVKLNQAGWKVIFTPDAVAEHRESESRGDDFNDEKLARFMFENEVMRQRYMDVLPVDPFYNRHFSREGGVYRELRLLQPGD